MSRRLVWGVGDSVVSSVATFIVGVYATRTLTLEELGAYGLFFAGSIVLATGFSAQLFFLPAEVALAEHTPDEQIATLPRTALMGLPIAAATSGVAGLACAAILGFDVDPILAFGAIATGAAWPIQDHLRRLLHQVGASGTASAISIVQLLIVTSVVLEGIAFDASPVVVPFTALLTANVGSAIFGLWLALQARRRARGERPRLRSVVAVGKWLVVAGQAEQIGAFVALASLNWLAGRSALGEYETARLLAQPMIVLSFGLQNFLRGPAMAAVAARDREAGRRTANGYLWLLGGAAVAYALVAGIEWPGNPFVSFFPAAYGLDGMVALTILAAAVMQSKGIYGLQALAGKQERELARVTLPNAPVAPVVVTALAVPLGAYAVPVGTVADRALWQLRFRPVFNSLFDPDPADDAASHDRPASPDGHVPSAIEPLPELEQPPPRSVSNGLAHPVHGASDAASGPGDGSAPHVVGDDEP
ncbi:MAG: hypothetical protein AAFZ07_27540 [Actinomycetota bacterium]